MLCYVTFAAVFTWRRRWSSHGTDGRSVSSAATQLCACQLFVSLSCRDWKQQWPRVDDRVTFKTNGCAEVATRTWSLHLHLWMLIVSSFNVTGPRFMAQVPQVWSEHVLELSNIAGWMLKLNWVDRRWCLSASSSLPQLRAHQTVKSLGWWQYETILDSPKSGTFLLNMAGCQLLCFTLDLL